MQVLYLGCKSYISGASLILYMQVLYSIGLTPSPRRPLFILPGCRITVSLLLVDVAVWFISPMGAFGAPHPTPPPPHPHGALRAPWALLAAWDILGMALKCNKSRVPFGTKAKSPLPFGLRRKSGVPFGTRLKSGVPFSLRPKSAVPFDPKPERHV